MENQDVLEAGPSAMANSDEENGMDEDQNPMDFMETTMETNEDDEENDNVVEVEPEIFLGSPSNQLNGDDSNSFLGPENCQVCRGPLSFHQNGEPCDVNQIVSFGGEHFLNNESSDYSNVSFDEGVSKRSSASGRKTILGSNCPVCDQPLHKQHARDHICWHFMDELKAMVTDPSKCPDQSCNYKGEKMENMCRHLALFHSKLDEFLNNDSLVQEKRVKALTKPKKVVIGTTCVICGLKDPAREHVSRHFMKELMEIVACLPDQTNCPECQYKGEKPQNLARHIALVHSKLDELLVDQDLIEERKKEFMSKPNKLTIGPNCPVCDQVLSKQHSRVHVIWHFMDELRSMVSTFKDPLTCELCEYTNVNSDKIAKHLALFHSKLDELLQNEELLMEKRAKAMSKPKKESIGPVCPICDTRDPPREHVARHFGEELSQFVSSLDDRFSCPECPYKGEKTKNLELHIALVHGMLDHFLKDSNLVKAKRQKFLSTPKKAVIGPKCPICDMKFTKSQNRDHVSWHFMEELREYVQTFPNSQQCPLCPYSSEKIDNLVKHLALGHSKLDELLQNQELVAAKRAKAMSKPKKVAIGPKCPVCDVKDPAREHVARHFSDELMEYINNLPSQTACNECDYKGDKPKTLSIHVALVHGKLDIILNNKDLVSMKRASFMAKPKKQAIGPVCPVCDMRFTKNQNRDHVAWHYMDELRAIVQEFPDPCQCTQCPYKSDSMEKMVKHVALGHSMLDGYLQDEELLQIKRLKALSKPKKVALGPKCPVCDVKDPPREHVARHFSDELLDIVEGFPDPTQCPDCIYRNEKPKNVGIHIALVHNILDQILTNEEIVTNKREKHFSKPQKVNLGTKCPVCDQPFNKGQNRDHVCWHFMDELRDIVMTFDNQESCPDCSYTSDKVDNLVKHIALGHSKLDELLQNEELVAQKREIFMSKPKKINIGPCCPICDMKFSKGQNRDHVSWHFMDELREFVRTTGYEKECTLCFYTTDKLDNLVKHYALGHSKLDELLQDEDLIRTKREIVKNKPKRLSFGKDCPICGLTGRDRDHVARHFMPELMEMVQQLPDQSSCDKCEYTNTRREYMAKHIALFHCKLDEMMQDPDLVAFKKEKAKSTPQKRPMGENCIICGASMPSREHVVRHFQQELQKLIAENSPSPLSCYECSFTANKPDYVSRHLGLVHCKLDEYLLDEEKVAQKIQEYQEIRKVNEGNGIAVKSLPLREAVRKSQRQRDMEERQAQELKLREEREAKAQEERERERERKRRREEIVKREKEAIVTMAPKIPRLEEIKPKFDFKQHLGSTGSLLKSTLLKSSSPEEKQGSLQITIKRTTPAKWQIKPKSAPPEVTATITQVTRAEIHESEPDISHLMVPEISHNMGDDDDEQDRGEVDNTLLNPEVILDTLVDADNMDSQEDEFCDVCGIEFDKHDKPCNPLDMDDDSDRPLTYNNCPVCDVEVPSREHITKHFLEELIEVVEGFPDPMSCPQCQYKTDQPSKTAIHISIAHSQLEKCLNDSGLVMGKRNELFAQSLDKKPNQTVVYQGIDNALFN